MSDKVPQFKIGELICEKHYPDRMGVVVGIIDAGKGHTAKLLIHWQNDNPRQYKPGRPEIVDSFYVEKVAEEAE